MVEAGDHCVSRDRSDPQKQGLGVSTQMWNQEGQREMKIKTDQTRICIGKKKG